jgi:glycogen debranching enzyme
VHASSSEHDLYPLPSDPNFKSTYDGTLFARDSAYHQGTVWAWLVGPFCDAWKRVHPDQKNALDRFLVGFNEHLSEDGSGTISEIFNATAPFLPRGCIAQAWSVAEVLLCVF